MSFVIVIHNRVYIRPIFHLQSIIHNDYYINKSNFTAIKKSMKTDYVIKKALIIYSKTMKM
jgi:hypothetical protein